MSKWFNKCQTVLYQYKPTEAIECLQQLSLKKDLIWSSETLVLVMSDIERTQLDFWSQDEFTELLCLQNGSTEHRNNWDVMKSPVLTYNRPWQHIIKINNSVIPFLVLHNNKKKSLGHSKTNPTAISWTLHEERRNFGISPFSRHKTVLFAYKKNRHEILFLPSLQSCSKQKSLTVLCEGCIHTFPEILLYVE